MEALIELGAGRGAPEPDVPPPPSRWWAVAALLLACTLLAGAAPTARPHGAAGPPLPLGALVLAAGPLLLVVDGGADPPALTAYDASPPRTAARWRATMPAAAGWSAETVGDLLLVTERDAARRVVATTARSLRTGEQRWRRHDRVYAAGDGAVAVTDVRSFADPGRRIEGTVDGVDPATGVTRWSVRLPSTAVLVPLPGTPARVLVLRDDGLARVYDVRDGAVRGEGLLPPADYEPDNNPQVVGDHLVLRHLLPYGAELVGYHLPDLTPRWRVPVEVGDLTIRPCDGLLCGQDRRDRWALVPATGVRAWTWPGAAPWRAVPGGRGPGPHLVLRPAEDGRTLVARVGRDGPRVVEVLPEGVHDCRVAADALACQVSGGNLTIWPVRT